MRHALNKWIIPLVWLAIAGVLQVYLFHTDYTRIQTKLDEEAGYLFDRVYDNTRLNELLLQSFSALVASQANDPQVMRRFATTLRARYPHIERLQIQTQINPEARSEFERSMQQRGYSYFSIRHPQQQAIPADSSFPEALYPYSFIEPYNADTRHLLGLDQSRDEVVAEPFRNSIFTHQPVASAPFTLEDGRNAYTLYQAVSQHHLPFAGAELQIASLVITFEGLLPSTGTLTAGTAFTLYDAEGNSLIQAGHLPQNSWLPIFSVEQKLNRFGQPLRIELTQAMRWQDINWSLMLGILLFSLALTKLAYAYLDQKVQNQRERRKALLQLEEERNLLEAHVTQRTQELNEQMLENQRLAHQLMEVQESERRHLARELHDELGQSLTAIRTDASMLKRLHPNESSAVHQSAESIDTIAQHIYGVTYDLMRSLRPTALDDLGLVDALRECITNLRINEKNIKLNTAFSGALNEMPETYNITIYRLVQESLTNILRHADAHEITLELHRRTDEVGDYLEMLICDDGNGSAPHVSPSSQAGYGVVGMRERVNALGGRFNLQGAPEQGTQVDVVIPLPPEPDETEADSESARPYPAEEVVRLH